MRFSTVLCVPTPAICNRAPIFLEAIARGSASIPFIIPEHIAKTDPFTQITDPTGCGPYKFVREEFVAGSFAAYARNPDYKPAKGAPDWTSGAKITHFERLGWIAVPEQATAAAALRSVKSTGTNRCNPIWSRN